MSECLRVKDKPIRAVIDCMCLWAVNVYVYVHVYVLVQMATMFVDVNGWSWGSGKKTIVLPYLNSIGNFVPPFVSSPYPGLINPYRVVGSIQQNLHR